MKMSDDMKTWKWVRLFMDTSAFIKVLADDLKEPGTDNLAAYLKVGTQIHTSNLCLGETLGVLKRKWLRKTITLDGYLTIINRLKWKLDHKRLFMHEISLSDGYDDALGLVTQHRVDYVDALLLNYFIQHKDTLDLFVTADRRLSKLACEANARCWNILKSTTPPE